MFQRRRQKNVSRPVFVKDVIPKSILRCGTAAAQAKRAADEKREHHVRQLQETRAKLDALRANLCAETRTSVRTNDLEALDRLGVAFLEELLEDTCLREQHVSRSIMAQQECVEMFKGAVLTEQLSEVYVETACLKRDRVVDVLRNIVLDREAVFCAREMITRRPVKKRQRQDGNGVFVVVAGLADGVVEYTMLKQKVAEHLDVLKS